MKKLKVDQTTCIGCGTCVALAPKSFKLTDEGKSVPINPAGDDQETVENALDSCPVDAISWEEG